MPLVSLLNIPKPPITICLSPLSWNIANPLALSYGVSLASTCSWAIAVVAPTPKYPRALINILLFQVIVESINPVPALSKFIWSSSNLIRLAAWAETLSSAFAVVK